MHSIQYHTSFWLYQIAILPFRLRHQWLSRQGKTEEAKQLAFRRARTWADFTLRRSGSRIQRLGLEHIPTHRTVLVVSNHQGEFDIPLIVSCLPRQTAFIAKVELSRIPLMSFWMKALGCLFLDRNDRRQMLNVSKQAIDQLQTGLNMVIFPEGTRSLSNQVAPFKKGSLNIAIRAGVAILPLAIRNSCQMKRKGELRVRKTDVRVQIFPLIETRDLSPEEKEQLSDRVHDLIQSGTETTDEVNPAGR